MSKHATIFMVVRNTGRQPVRASLGQAALSFILLIGGIVFIVGSTLIFLALSFINSGFGVVAAQRATAISHAGAHDAIMQLVRNKDFSSSGYAVPLPMGSTSYTATVTVNQRTPAPEQATVFSIATVGTNRREIQVIVSVASTTGHISVISWRNL